MSDDTPDQESREISLANLSSFDDTARVIYPLGDPAGADSSFDEIDSSGGTYIAEYVHPQPTPHT